jgi:hypothetical protein
MDNNKTNQDINIQICNELIKYFLQYQDIMYKVFTTSQNLTLQINNIKKNIFDNLFISYYEEMMINVSYFMESIKNDYKPKYFLALADFIDLVYQNAFYDIFTSKLAQMENSEPEKITSEHMKIFYLIVYVEHIKYELYSELELKTTNQNILNTLKKRKSNNILRINVCDNILKKYNENDYLNIIDKYNIYTPNPEFSDISFTKII